MSSAGVAGTARSSREHKGHSSDKDANGCRIILPTIPSGSVSFNTLFLNSDPVGRPYNVEHFGVALKEVASKSEVSGFGTYKFNHVWAISFHMSLGKEQLLSKKEIQVKGRKCLIFDPNKKEVDIKVHWIPVNVPTRP